MGKLADRLPDSKNGTDESEDRNRPDEDIDQGVSGLHPVVINFRLIVEDGVDFLFLGNSPEVVEDPPDSAEDDTVLEFLYFLRFKKLRDFDDSFFHIPNVDAFAQRFVKFMVTKRGVGPLLLAVSDEFEKNQK